MKNIITILLILILPVALYLFFSKNSGNISVAAKNANMPSILIFTSSMCMDCQKMKGIIKELEPEYNNKINFISINAIDKSKKVQESIKKHNVTLVPTLIFLNEDGNQTNKIEGYIPKEQFIKEIEDAING